jgi:hypothetical protein
MTLKKHIGEKQLFSYALGRYLTIKGAYALTQVDTDSSYSSHNN